VQYLKLQHHSDKFLAVGQRHAATLVKDGFQFATGNFIKMQLHKSIAECSGQHLNKRSKLINEVTAARMSYFSSSVETRRVLRGKKHELRMSFDDLLGFWDHQFSVVIQDLKNSSK
jgi:hypothetical protein